MLLERLSKDPPSLVDLCVSDSELVDEIVADVREKLYPTGTIGFYSRFLGIENLLCKQSHDIYRLVVWGTPGVGKTTIAQTAFNLMSQDFEVHCFLEDFHSLAKLKIINLSHSQKLVEVDELSKACSLKEIVLKGCTTLERTPRIDQLKTLELLDLSCCTRIKRNDVTDMIKPLDTGGLREIESGSMVFSTQGKTSDNTEKF
ncbi:hypothetical protein Bca4012_077939 [Brassica carinata]